MTAIITGTVLDTTFPGTNVGDTWTLTVVTDGFVGVCSVANGHLISVTPGGILAAIYAITNDALYPATPTFDSTSGALVGQNNLIGGGLYNGLFTYGALTFSISAEDTGADGVVGVLKKCLQ